MIRAIACGGLMLIFCLIALAVHLGVTAPIDRALLLAMAPPSWLAATASAATWLGNGLTRALITAGAAMFLFLTRDVWRAVALTAIVAGGAVLSSAIKLAVMRPRPDLLPHLDHVSSSSFPSGHAANGAILYLALAMLVPVRYRRVSLAGAVALMLAIGLSRIILAVHWPSDVLAGWCLGAGWLVAWGALLTRPQPVDPA